MQNSIYMSAAGALAAETRMDVIANNLANVDSPGFKRGYVIVQKRLAEAVEPPRFEPSWDPVLDRLGGGLFVQEVVFQNHAGAVHHTGGELDVALTGDGWFTVSQGGQELYTRAGNFRLRADGALVTASGTAQVLDTAGNPISLGGSGQISISNRGVIQQGNEAVAQLGVRGTMDYRLFHPVGENLYRYVGNGAPELAEAEVQPGFLESSTVSPVQEMVNMIHTFRAYETNQRMITLQDQIMGRVANDVGRVA